MRKLLVQDAHGERELLMAGRMDVGRDPRCDISDSDPLLSRRHAEFTEEADGVRVRDLHSRNGLQVNGVDVNEAVLHSGDVVRIARVTIRYVDEAAAPPAAEAAPVADADPDATVMVAAPALADTTQPPARPAAAGIDDDATVLVPFDAMASKARAASGPRRFQPAPRDSAPAAARTPARRSAWTTRITVHVVGLSVVVCLVTAVPLWIWPGRALMVTGPALVCAVIAGLVVATQVRRIAIAAMEAAPEDPRQAARQSVGGAQRLSR
jgi:hypothetical protein